MTSFHFSTLTFFALQAVAWLGGGALIGAGYFLTLCWNVRLLALRRAPLVATIVQLGRFALLAGLLAAITDCYGALPLISAVAGIIAVRTMITTQSEALT